MANCRFFFIVGAPKCGTTSMYYYLSQHPDIYMSHNKEPHYFSPDLQLSYPSHVDRLDTYLSLFKGREPGQLCGEASVFYLYSTEAAERIAQFAPESKIIIMLRNPVDMMFSLHREFLSNGNENLTSFREALAAESDRSRGQRIPQSCTMSTCLQYSKVASFHEQVKRYYQVFGQERVHIVLLESMREEPLDEYRKVLNFLDVDPSFVPVLTAVNRTEAKKIRNLRIRQFISSNPMMRKLLGLLPERLRTHAGDVLQVITGDDGAYLPSKLDGTTRQKLMQKREDEIISLEQLIGMDLSRWRP